MTILPAPAIAPFHAHINPHCLQRRPPRPFRRLIITQRQVIQRPQTRVVRPLPGEHRPPQRQPLAKRKQHARRLSPFKAPVPVVRQIMRYPAPVVKARRLRVRPGRYQNTHHFRMSQSHRDFQKRIRPVQVVRIRHRKIQQRPDEIRIRRRAANLRQQRRIRIPHASFRTRLPVQNVSRIANAAPFRVRRGRIHLPQPAARRRARRPVHAPQRIVRTKAAIQHRNIRPSRNRTQRTRRRAYRMTVRANRAPTAQINSHRLQCRARLLRRSPVVAKQQIIHRPQPRDVRAVPDEVCVCQRNRLAEGNQHSRRMTPGKAPVLIPRQIMRNTPTLGKANLLRVRAVDYQHADHLNMPQSHRDFQK